MTSNKTETESMGNAAISKWALGCVAVGAVFGAAEGCWVWQNECVCEGGTVCVCVCVCVCLCVCERGALPGVSGGLWQYIY